MPKAATQRAVTARRTNPVRGAAVRGCKKVKAESDVEESKPTTIKGKAKAKTSPVLRTTDLMFFYLHAHIIVGDSPTAKKSSTTTKKSPTTDKTPKATTAAKDPIRTILSILDDHIITPADLILALIQASPKDGNFKYLQDDLYYPYGTSKLDGILDALCEAKHGRIVLKEWMKSSEMMDRYVEGVLDRELYGERGVDSEEEVDSDDDDDCGHCCM
ncbi:hypothetical protein NMY22_g16788 [Coprinellus aureogranulatus]|nr:hypothetical protein NMY22_g16788 [Coprinellus aureogranulatus]